jgi:hypothetical protein
MMEMVLASPDRFSEGLTPWRHVRGVAASAGPQRTSAMPAIAISKSRRGGHRQPQRTVLCLAALLWLPLGAMLVKALGL